MTMNVRIGGVETPRSEVLEYVARYLSGDGTWAYPAYDTYRGDSGGPVDDADLLAVALLNAGQKAIPTYYTLQNLLVPINNLMSSEALDGDFATADDDTLSAIADLFGILDNHSTPNVGKTKLMKVLHRKKPATIPLFDENIRRCYSVLGDPPIPPDKSRTHREFAVLWLKALQKDLSDQLEFFDEIASMALPDAPITSLRAMDIVAWHVGARRRKGK